MLNLVFIWLKEHSLVMLLLLGTIFNVFWLYRMRRQLQMKWYAVLILSVLHTAIGVCSVKVFAFLESGDIGNMSLFGGVFFYAGSLLAGSQAYQAALLQSVRCVYSVYAFYTDVCSGQLHRRWMLLRLSYTGNAFSLSNKGTRDSLLHCDADPARSQSEKEQEPRQYLPTIYGILRSVPLY